MTSLAALATGLLLFLSDNPLRLWWLQFVAFVPWWFACTASVPLSRQPSSNSNRQPIVVEQRMAGR